MQLAGRQVATCNAPGPKVRVSPKYEVIAECNRVAGHSGPHRLYDPQTFAVKAEWKRTRQISGPIKRQKIEE